MNLINETNYARTMLEQIEPELKKIRTDSYTESSDGAKIHLEKYEHPNGKGAVVVLHGFTESAEKFREMSYYFYNEGYSVYAVDLRGHGLSSRTSAVTGRVEIDSFEEYAEDLNCIIEKEIKPSAGDKDIYIYSHSLGSTAALLYMINHPHTVKKAVLSSPMICGNMGMPVAVAGTVAKLLCALGGKKISAPGRCVFNPGLPFAESDSASRARFEYYHEKRKENALLQTNGPSFGWVKASLEARDKILSHAHEIKGELMILKPEQDKQLLMEYTDKFIQKSGANTAEFKASKHEIFFSENAVLEEYLKTIVEFFG